MYKIPDIIGAPDFQNDPDGFEKTLGSESYRKLVENSLQMVYITPMDTKITKSINIYEGRNAWDEYVQYLSANNISPGNNSNKLTVAVNNITPLSETYSNEFGQSEIFSSLQNMASGGLHEASFITGISGGEDLSDALKNSGHERLSGLVDGLVEGVNGIGAGLDKILSTKDSPSQVGSQAAYMITHPAEKIDIPTIWKGNSFNAQYEISVRLQCFNSSDEQVYGSKILASFGALLQFCTPRSQEGKFYKWPFLLSFEIPGLVNLPLAYCSSMTVVKGGDVNDIAWNWRPNIVDLRMTINTVWGVTINSKQPSNSEKDRPTVFKEIETLSKMRQLSNNNTKRNLSNSSSSADDIIKYDDSGNIRNKDLSLDSVNAASALSQ